MKNKTLAHIGGILFLLFVVWKLGSWTYTNVRREVYKHVLGQIQEPIMAIRRECIVKNGLMDCKTVEETPDYKEGFWDAKMDVNKQIEELTK